MNPCYNTRGLVLLPSHLKYLVIAITFVALWNPCSAQVLNIDSLKVVNSRTESSLKKCNLLSEIAWQYAIINRSDSSLAYSKKTIALSSKLNSQKTEAEAFNLIGLVYTYQGIYDSAYWYYYKALHIRKTLKPLNDYVSSLENIGNVLRAMKRYTAALDTLKLAYRMCGQLERVRSNYRIQSSILHNIGTTFQDLHKTDSALYYYRKAKVIINQYKENSNCLGGTDYNLALLFEESLHQYDSALVYANKALNLRQSLNNPVQLAECYFLLGNIYFDMRNYSEALPFYFKSVHYDKRRPECKLVAGNYHNIALCYKNLKYESEQIYYHQLEINELRKNKTQGELLASRYYDLAVIYLKTKKNDSALTYFNQALLAYSFINNKNEMAHCYIKIGNIHYELSDPESARNNFMEVFKLEEDSVTAAHRADASYNIGLIYYHKKDETNALVYFKKSLQLYEQMKDKESQIDACTKIASCYSRLNDTENETIYRSKCKNLK